jgi:pyruvate kinase
MGLHVQAAAEHLKRQAATDWLPEYRPVSIVPPGAAAAQTYQKTTKISPAMILQVRPSLASLLAGKQTTVCTAAVLGPSLQPRV